MLGVGPSLCHGTLTIALLAAVLRAMLWCLKHNEPFHSSSPTLSLISCSLDELYSYIPQPHIFLSYRLLLGISSSIYMYGPFTICVD